MGTEAEYGISVSGQPRRTRCSRRPRSSTPTPRPRSRRAGPGGTSRRSRRCATPAASTCPARSPTPASSPTRTWAWPTSSSPTARGSTSTTRTRSTPRPRSPTRATPSRWDKAGEQVMLDAQRRASQLPTGAPIVLYKNNTDNKGASYGAHENYLMRRATPFADIVRHLTPFFVSRQVVSGAGRVGIGQDGRDARLPDQPARRLLRGRGRAGDHAEAARSSTPVTSRTPTRRSTAGCT